MLEISCRKTIYPLGIFIFLWGFNFKVFKNKKKMFNAHFEERLHKVNMFKFRNCT